MAIARRAQRLAKVFHFPAPEKRGVRSASVRIIDDYTVEITRPGRKIKTRTGGTTETNSFCLLDVTSASEKRLMAVLESSSFEAHEYTDWHATDAFMGYEVDVVEYCYKCPPTAPEPEPRRRYISWMDNPKYRYGATCYR